MRSSQTTRALSPSISHLQAVNDLTRQRQDVLETARTSHIHDAHHLVPLAHKQHRSGSVEAFVPQIRYGWRYLRAQIAERRPVEPHLQLRGIVVDRIRKHRRLTWVASGAVWSRGSPMENGFAEILHRVLIRLAHPIFL